MTYKILYVIKDLCFILIMYKHIVARIPYTWYRSFFYITKLSNMITRVNIKVPRK